MMSAIHNPQEVSTPSQRLAAAARQARLHRFATASMPERLPGSVTLKAMAPIPNEKMAEAIKLVFPPLNRVDAIQRATIKAVFPTMTLMELKAERRTAMIVRARQIAMYLSKKYTSQSLPEIGRRFGGRDHTTVLHAVRKIEQKLQNDKSLVAEVESIKALIPDIVA